jgi:ankyrin repeat protein
MWQMSMPKEVNMEMRFKHLFCIDREEMVRFLVGKGANVNCGGGNFESPLQAAIFKGYKEIVHYLVERGANVNAQGSTYGNPLQTAAIHNNAEIVQFLIERTVDVNADGGK